MCKKKVHPKLTILENLVYKKQPQIIKSKSLRISTFLQSSKEKIIGKMYK